MGQVSNFTHILSYYHLVYVLMMQMLNDLLQMNRNLKIILRNIQAFILKMSVKTVTLNNIQSRMKVNRWVRWKQKQKTRRRT